MYETSGRLRSAIEAYLSHLFTRHSPPSNEQIALIRYYLSLWIHSPAFGEGFEVEKAALRESVRAIATPADIREWISQAREIGIDPI